MIQATNYGFFSLYHSSFKCLFSSGWASSITKVKMAFTNPSTVDKFYQVKQQNNKLGGFCLFVCFAQSKRKGKQNKNRKKEHNKMNKRRNSRPNQPKKERKKEIIFTKTLSSHLIHTSSLNTQTKHTHFRTHSHTPPKRDIGFIQTFRARFVCFSCPEWPFESSVLEMVLLLLCLLDFLVFSCFHLHFCF